MAKTHNPFCLTVVICILLLSGQAVAYAQDSGVTRETTSEGNSTQVPSGKRRILINIAKAVVDVLCAEYGNCTANRNNPAETSTGAKELGRYLTPGFAGTNSSSDPQQRSFSFSTPSGWQTFEGKTSVTVAPRSEYVNNNLVNGVILGLFDLNNASFESGTETYVRGLLSDNRYLKRVGWPETSVVSSVPCITNRMEGQSPQTHYLEKVVVYTCKRSSLKLFYVVTVNSGPNANQYEEENNRMTQTISFSH